MSTPSVVICSFNVLTVKVAEELCAAGVRVVVIDDDQPSPPKLARRLAELGAALVHGSADDPATLAQAGMSEAVAAVVLDEDDVSALACTLTLTELYPTLCVVVRVANPLLGAQLQSLSRVTTLDRASAAAPTFVAACLGTAPLLQRGESSFAVVTQGEGHQLVRQPTQPEPWSLTRSRSVRRLLTLWFQDADRLLKRTLAAVLGLTAVSTVLLTVFLHPMRDGKPVPFGPLRALYFTVTTLATVGFGDYSFASEQWPLVVFGIFLIVAGTAFTTILYASLTEFILARRLAPGVSWAPGDLTDHVIVVGLGSQGWAVAQELCRQGQKVLVVEENRENRFLASAKAAGVPVLLARSSSPEVLARAGIARAKAVALLTSEDLVNVESALLARANAAELGNQRCAIVLRVFDPQLAKRLGESFDVALARSTSGLVAPLFAAAALGATPWAVLPAGGEDLLVLEPSAGSAESAGIGPTRDVLARLAANAGASVQ